MADLINLSRASVDASGRITLSGLATGIDFRAAADAIIKAKQIPADRLKTEISANDKKITALADLRTSLNTLKDALSKLRGAVSIGDADNIFKAKQAFASTGRTDGKTPSAASSLVGVALTNASALGSRTIEVLRVAKAHKVGSASFNSLTTDLGTARGQAPGSIVGSFNINGVAIQVLATDKLTDLRDRINAANTGTSATGVTASIVSVSTTEHYLVLTHDKTGTSITVNTEVGGVLNAMGISSNGGTTFSNELQKPRTARFTADGLLDPDRFESRLVSSKTAALSTLTTGTTYPGSFQINGTGTATINYDSTTTLQTLVTAVNAQTATTGVTASIVDEDVGHRLVLTHGTSAAFTLTDTNGLLGALGVDNEQVVERTGNTITDLYAGTTLTLFGAEEGTKIKIDVERSLTSVKSQVTAFVDAYNALKTVINTHSYVDPATGAKTDKTGVLFGSRTLAEIEQKLANLAGTGVDGVSVDYRALVQVGIKFVDNKTLADPLKADTFVIDAAKLDAVLLSNPEDVRKLFTFDFSSSDPRVSLLGFTAKTAYNAAGYTINIGNVGPGQRSSVAVTSATATLNNASSFAATTSGLFQINGTNINYNIATDTLDSVVSAINAAAISGVTASKVTTSSGTFKIQINSATNPLTIGGDTGDLVSRMTLSTDGYLVGQANIGGAADGTANGTVSPSQASLTVTSPSTAEGLKVFYSGNSNVSGITLKYTIGLGAQLHFAVEQMVDAVSGSVENDIKALKSQNDLSNKRITEITQRLEIQRQTILDKFIAAEQSMAILKRALDSINQINATLSPRR